MARRTLEQRHSVTMKVGTPMTIPWVSKKGVTFVLESDGEKIGELRITGAQVHVRRSPKQNWVVFSFSKFLDQLV
jgi:hypothetical protein